MLATLRRVKYTKKEWDINTARFSVARKRNRNSLKQASESSKARVAALWAESGAETRHNRGWRIFRTER